MDADAINEAARLLARARQTRQPLERLPPSCRPGDAGEAYAIELALLREIDETLAGWKVAVSPEYGVLMGLLVRSRVFASGARIPTRDFSMRGVEAEIAFRFVTPLAPRASPYTRADVEASVTALPAIEIVDTRFASYESTPTIERTADFMANGALVIGTARADWRAFDLANIEVRVAIDGQEILRRVGGHPSRDPLLPAIALVNQLRQSTGIAEGTVVTTGSYSGMHLAPLRCAIEIGFAKVGAAACELV